MFKPLIFMIPIHSEEEIELIRASAMAVTATLTEVARQLKPGMTTLTLDKMAEEFILDLGGRPSFKNFNGYPYSLCISVNDAVVHGFPGEYVIQEGDIVSVDCGVYMNGFHGDHAYTFGIGEVDPRTVQLMERTRQSLLLGIKEARVGQRVGDISYVIQQATEKAYGYGVVRELVGHGVGRTLHEDPQVPNYGRRGTGKRLKRGMVIAIEPMINLGTREINTLEDGWTIVTADGKPSVHFEHTVAIGEKEGEALSQFGPIEEAIRANPALNKSYF